MTEAPAGAPFFRLLSWLSPSFPVGSFSYSHGLESAVEDGLVASREDLAEWIGVLVGRGSGWNDAVLLAESWRCARDRRDLGEVAELAEALAGSRERHMESTLQGAAFMAAAANWPGLPLPDLPENPAYCVAVGAVAGADGLPLPAVLAAFGHAFASNMAQAAIRLGVIGQAEAVALVAGFEGAIVSAAERAASSTLDDLGSSAIMAEIGAMRHETQHTRLFRS